MGWEWSLVFSLYPSFVISLFFLSTAIAPTSGFVQRKLGVTQAWIGWLTLPFVVTLLLHFAHPYVVWYPLCLAVSALAYLVITHSGFAPDVVQYLFVGLAVNLFQEKMTVWYPFTSWHGLPMTCIMSIMWFCAAMFFSKTAGDRLKVIASLAATRILCSDHLWTLVVSHHAGTLDFTRCNADCNLFWLTLVVLFTWNTLSSLVSSHRFRPVI